MSPTLPVPSASTAKAPKPKPSPPSAESLCLKTFRACWYLDKDWLVSFVASAQCARPDAPITWVEFMPKGHTHLVRSALKLVPISKHLPLAKIKEVMFTFILETLNAPGTSPGFFNARKAAKTRKRTRKRKVGEKQPVDDMAVDALPPDPSPPPLSTGNPSGSTPAPSAGAGNEGDKGKVPPGPSSEAPGTRGVDPVPPRASSFPDPASPPTMSLEEHIAESKRITAAALAARLAERRRTASQAGSLASTRAPSPSPSVTSVLGKRSSPPPPTSPPPLVGSPIRNAPQDWRAWMEWKRAAYLARNPGRPVPAVVTPLDLHEAAPTASPSPVSPPSPLPSPHLPPPSTPPLLQTPPKKGKKQKPRTSA